jgi:hypothetical protein
VNTTLQGEKVEERCFSDMTQIMHLKNVSDEEVIEEHSFIELSPS